MDQEKQHLLKMEAELNVMNLLGGLDLFVF
jgi:hypothetical protein